MNQHGYQPHNAYDASGQPIRVVYVERSSMPQNAASTAVGVAGGLFLYRFICGLGKLGLAVVIVLGTCIGAPLMLHLTDKPLDAPGNAAAATARERHEAAAKARREGTTPPAAPAEPAQPSDLSDPYEPGRQAPAPSDPLNPATPSQPIAHPSAPPSR